jgi:acetylglutamate kinase
VLDASGATITSMTTDDVDAMIASGTAHSGMVAKLTACRAALTAGVNDVAIVSGRGAMNFDSATGTRVLAACNA